MVIIRLLRVGLNVPSMCVIVWFGLVFFLWVGFYLTLSVQVSSPFSIFSLFSLSCLYRVLFSVPCIFSFFSFSGSSLFCVCFSFFFCLFSLSLNQKFFFLFCVRFSFSLSFFFSFSFSLLLYLCLLLCLSFFYFVVFSHCDVFTSSVCAFRLPHFLFSFSPLLVSFVYFVLCALVWFGRPWRTFALLFCSFCWLSEFFFLNLDLWSRCLHFVRSWIMFPCWFS